jgi:hypothetical protein
MTGVVHDGEDMGFAFDDGVVDAVWEASKRSPPNVKVKDRVEARVLLDMTKDILHQLQESLSQSWSTRVIPACGLVEISLDPGPEDESHARLRRRAFMSFQGMPAAGSA